MEEAHKLIRKEDTDLSNGRLEGTVLALRKALDIPSNLPLLRSGLKLRNWVVSDTIT